MSHVITSGGGLCISVTFLTGRYHGEEWPPSPARLFQALVAAVMTCGYQEFETFYSPGTSMAGGAARPHDSFLSR